ncbi:integrase [Gossypium australe]|uniref:Integrase n=1 Tax=Gossypium australe TaxID=47621 RepID=A0A5B6UXV3_9ROSI|nr:integrase [Gossypium australe]
MMILEWKCDRVTMDFVSDLPLSPKKKDAIWFVIRGLPHDSGRNYQKIWVCSLTLAPHFIHKSMNLKATRRDISHWLRSRIIISFNRA